MIPNIFMKYFGRNVKNNNFAALFCRGKIVNI